MNRKDFLTTSGLAGAAMLMGAGNALAFRPPVPAPNAFPFELGLASYTFRSFSLDETIDFARRLGLKKLMLKSMHLPLEASPEEIKASVQKIKDAGMSVYGGGVIYMKTEQEVDQAFEYAKNAGLEMIVGVPNHELLGLVEKKVKSYDIKVAIHNHGPGDKLYSSVHDIQAKIKNLDKRIGICIDVGHVVRIKEDPAEMILKYKDRLYDCHLKDADKAEADGKAIEVGRGVIDIPKLLKTLIQVKYKGNLSLEYEKDGKDPLAGAAESVGYTRGVLKML